MIEFNLFCIITAVFNHLNENIELYIVLETNDDFIIKLLPSIDKLIPFIEKELSSLALDYKKIHFIENLAGL